MNPLVDLNKTGMIFVPFAKMQHHLRQNIIPESRLRAETQLRACNMRSSCILRFHICRCVWTLILMLNHVFIFITRVINQCLLLDWKLIYWKVSRHFFVKIFRIKKSKNLYVKLVAPKTRGIRSCSISDFCFS